MFSTRIKYFKNLQVSVNQALKLEFSIRANVFQKRRHGTLALVVYGGYAPVGRIHVPFTHRDCCVKKEI